MAEPQAGAPNLLALTAQITAALVSNNDVAAAKLPDLIRATFAALSTLGPPAPEPASEPKFTGAVSVRKSLADGDKIISMIDGKAYSSLKRHIRKHGLSPDEYRARYRLPENYPMVSPGYSALRREMSLKLGLGRKKVAQPVEAPLPPAVKRTGRKAKTTTDDPAPAAEQVAAPIAKRPRKRASQPAADH